MRRLTFTRAVLLGLAVSASGAYAADTVSHGFNGTGFVNDPVFTGYDFDSWTGNITSGATFVEIAGSATEIGGAGIIYGVGALKDFSGMAGVELTAQLGAGNVADNFQVSLIDLSGVQAVYRFAASDFDAGNMTASFQSTFDTFDPQGFGRDVDRTQIWGLQFSGDFTPPASTDAVHVLVDNIAVTAVPEASSYAMFGLGLLGVMAARRLRRPRV